MKEYIEIIGCRGCDSKNCYVCNILTIAEMLNNGAFDGMMDEYHSIIPAADVVERKRGEWVHTTIEDEDWGGTYHRWTCSVCGGRVSGNPAGSNFCKWCGADMRGEKNVR